MRIHTLILATLSLFISVAAHAGEANCTDIKTVQGDYEATSEDCIIRVQNTYDTTSSVVTLPDGGEFTVQDDSAYEDDHCEFYQDEEYPEYSFTFCQPRSITVRSATSNYTIDYGQDTTLTGFYIQGSPHRQSLKLTDDSAGNWTGDYTNWR